MENKKELPNKIPIFPLSNFIIFPETTVPLNIFEPRYIEMIDDVMKGSKVIGVIQPKKSNNTTPKLHNVGCAGKITSFNETEDGRYLIVINGLSRFKIINEIKNKKSYRECEISFNEFQSDLITKKEKINFSDLNLIFNDLKKIFKKKGYMINWKKLQKQSLNHTINTLSMASPFSLEEKQVLLETQNLNLRKTKLEEILKTYAADNFSNTTIQ
jgi:hypothetical protein